MMTEDQLEQETLGWLQEVGYQPLCVYDIAPEGPIQERADYLQPVLIERLRGALARLNPQAPLVAREDALRQVLDLGIPSQLSANRRFHNLLVQGVKVEYQKEGETRGGRGLRGERPVLRQCCRMRRGRAATRLACR